MKFLQNKKVLGAILLVLVIGAGAGAYFYFNQQKPKPLEQKTEMPKFKSCDTFVNAYKTTVEKNNSLKSPMAAEDRGGGEDTPEHSETNIQVAGVDEADIVKNDGKYIYTISGDSVFILSAYPPEGAKIIAKIEYEKDTTKLSELFIDGDRLIVIGSSYIKKETEKIPSSGQKNIIPPYYSQNFTFIKTYDTSNKEKPKLVRNVEYEGSYSTSRKVESNVYVVLTTSPNYYLYNNKTEIKDSDIIPKYKDEKNESKKDLTPVCGCADIGYFAPDKFSSFISIVSVPVKDNSKEVDKKVIAGYSENVYASTKNIYVASSNSSYYSDWPTSGGVDEKTNIYKFKMDGPSTQFLTSSEVPGTILNQFSMDEYNNYFRIATTKGQVWDEKQKSKNNVYVLDSDMKIMGKVEGLAEGEKIYSARFMGNKAYLVTFKKIDPFFTLDMSDPKNPKVLGALKIPGYSDYLHPYDENHIIGIGKNTVEAEQELKNERGIDFAWYQGIKIALFDVTDFKNPKEMFKVSIGDRGTDSYALEDHKAFLFDKDKRLLVLPIALAELTEAQKKSQSSASTYGKFIFQGAYVYDISLEGINFKGRITHTTDSSVPKDEYYYNNQENDIQRTLYIGDYLYTVSNEKIKANKLSDLSQAADINLK